MLKRALVSVLITALLTSTSLACSFLRDGGGADGSKVTFHADDGFALSGRVFGQGPKGVILSHAFPTDQSSWFGFAKTLANNGYQALTFDFRGYGDSQGKRDIAAIDRDVRGAIRFMQLKRHVRSVVLVGASMGGTASLIAAGTASVRGVICLSAPETFMGLDAMPGLASIAAPKLFLASSRDPAGAAASAQDMFKRSLDPASDIRLVAGSRHGTDMLDGREGEEVRGLVKRFLARVSS